MPRARLAKSPVMTDLSWAKHEDFAGLARRESGWEMAKALANGVRQRQALDGVVTFDVPGKHQEFYTVVLDLARDTESRARDTHQHKVGVLSALCRSCECDDFRKSGTGCKHQVAALLHFRQNRGVVAGSAASAQRAAAEGRPKALPPKAWSDSSLTVLHAPPPVHMSA